MAPTANRPQRLTWPAAVSPPGPDCRAAVGWSWVREQFQLRTDQAQFSAYVLAPHPAPVRSAIAEHRANLDQDPIGYHRAHDAAFDLATRKSAAACLGASYRDIAVTGSATAGLAMLYNGMRIRADQEVLTTVHDFYSTKESLRLRSIRSGISIRTIALYTDPAAAQIDQMLDTIAANIQPNTRCVALTWVHSGTGVTIPIREIADHITEINSNRSPEDRILLCVDAVHACGLLSINFADIGCDFLVTSGHKWLFGARGTGLIIGRPEAWRQIDPTIPNFTWITEPPPPASPPGYIQTPGGYHAFEHRWALEHAFEFQQTIGRTAIQERTLSQTAQLLDGLRRLPHVRLLTPYAPGLFAGIVCFTVNGTSPADTVQALREGFDIIATTTPYATTAVRVGPSIVTSPAEVDQLLAAVATL
ncbi:Selenocysteine lyase/Cysteine desulfurase [Amycolatopsis australiensis]|uniref:Selenocysteine lyase/Cysteine desulfurase n=1 Tax=Amycolatopsis australiensis TaxID=546364 RepID=A0A1K1RT15_9PSEU|nr:Selenocysteine lyase/Cysteine desulfurase [Amycolatopsis australiensis]